MTEYNDFATSYIVYQKKMFKQDKEKTVYAIPTNTIGLDIAYCRAHLGAKSAIITANSAKQAKYLAIQHDLI